MENDKDYKQDLTKPKTIKIDKIGWSGFIKQWDIQVTEFVKKFISIFGIDSFYSKEGLMNTLKERKISFDPGVFSGGLHYPPQNSKDNKEIQECLNQIIRIIKEVQASDSKEEQVVYGRTFEFEVLSNDGLLYPPADEQMILEAEQRLQITLPTSYKEFLRVSNGFLNSFGRLLPVQEIGWIKDKDPVLFSIWGAENQIHQIIIPDDLYFVYGKKQDAIHMRAEYMSSCLLIGNNYGIRGGATWLLNPKIQLQSDEWEVWVMEAGDIGAIRYRNFKEQMEERYPIDIEYLNEAFVERGQSPFSRKGSEPFYA